MKRFLVCVEICLLFACEVFTQENYFPSFTFSDGKQTKMNYEKTGNGDTTLIFLHGFGASLQTWNDIRPGLAGVPYSMYFIDFMGFGFSPLPPDKDFTFKAQANRIVSFIKSNNLRNVVLIGHSFGGGVALMVQACNQSDSLGLDIVKLVLIDPGCYMTDIPFFIHFLKNPVLNFFSTKMTPVKTRAKIIVRKTFKNKARISPAIIDRNVYFFSRENYNYAVTQAARQIVPTDYHKWINAYSQIKVPTLIIWGRNDKMIKLANGERLHSQMLNSQLHVLDECGHVPQEEYPEKTAKLIIDFIIRN